MFKGFGSGSGLEGVLLVVLDASGHHFGGLFVTLGVPGLPWASPWALLGSLWAPAGGQVGFLSVFDGFWAPPGDDFGTIVWLFLFLGRQSARSGCGPLFLMPLGWKKEPDAAAL